VRLTLGQTFAVAVMDFAQGFASTNLLTSLLVPHQTHMRIDDIGYMHAASAQRGDSQAHTTHIAKAQAAGLRRTEGIYTRSTAQATRLTHKGWIASLRAHHHFKQRARMPVVQHLSDALTAFLNGGGNAHQL
jgi:hypothetical protein